MDNYKPMNKEEIEEKKIREKEFKKELKKKAKEKEKGIKPTICSTKSNNQKI